MTGDNKHCLHAINICIEECEYIFFYVLWEKPLSLLINNVYNKKESLNVIKIQLSITLYLLFAFYAKKILQCIK